MTILEKARPKLPKARKPKKPRDPNRAKFLAKFRAQQDWYDRLDTDSRRANCPRWRKRWARVVVGTAKTLFAIAVFFASVLLSVGWVVAGLPIVLWATSKHLRELWSD